jgi:GT2 family glycosyltransferase
VTRAARVGVVVLDHKGPADATRAADSAQDAELDVRVLIVENGSRTAGAARYERLRLAENRGFAGGMNAGIQRLLAEGCDRILLLNNDAVLEAGCLRQLADALDDPGLGAVGPVVLRQEDGRVESRGVSVDLRWGRTRLVGHGAAPDQRVELERVPAVSGAVMMLNRSALERVGLLDESYFFSFEDLDWCLRARALGFELAVARGARARHVGHQTIGRGSCAHLYYAARNHLGLVEKLDPRHGLPRWARRRLILALNLAHALKQTNVPRFAAVTAVLTGSRDAGRGRFGQKQP